MFLNFQIRDAYARGELNLAMMHRDESSHLNLEALNLACLSRHGPVAVFAHQASSTFGGDARWRPGVHDHLHV